MAMKLRRLSRNLAVLLVVVAVLGSVNFALGAPFETWSGPYSFTAKGSELNDATGKFVKNRNTSAGIMEMYCLQDGPPTQNGGYYIRFIDSERGFKVGITALEILSTRVPNSKSDKIMGVGAGVFLQNDLPVGPAYCTINGTVAKDGSGNPTTITATLTTGGGQAGDSVNPEAVWSGKLKVTLHKQP
jgi:hypothetical protein